MARRLHIGQAARETGLGIHAIRFYERKGLLREPPRSEGGYRVFDGAGLSDLIFIRRAQSLGFSLSEIRELLILRHSTSQACSHVRDRLAEKLKAVREKIRELKKLETELQSELRKCSRELQRKPASHEKTCPVLAELGRSSWETGGQRQ